MRNQREGGIRMPNYGQMADEELIRRYREGDRDALDHIMEKYKDQVRKEANAMYLLGGENEDLIQEGMIGLFKAIRDYDDTKETSFFISQNCVLRDSYTRQLRRRTGKNMRRSIPMFL